MASKLAYILAAGVVVSSAVPVDTEARAKRGRTAAAQLEILLDTKDGELWHKALMPTLHVFRSAKKHAESQSRECQVVDEDRFSDVECLRLRKPFRTPGSRNSITQVYHQPLSSLAARVLTNHQEGAAVRELDLPSNPLRFVDQYVHFHSFELVSETILGDETLKILREAAEEQELFCEDVDEPDIDIRTCRKYFEFEATGGRRGVAGCSVQTFREFVGPPEECFIQALRLAAGWYIGALINPVSANDGEGDGSEALSCSFKPGLLADEVGAAVREVFSRPPFDLTFGAGVQSTRAIIGKRNGGQSQIMRQLGRGLYYENLIFIGSLSPETEFGTVLTGSLSINVNRTEGGLERIPYALNKTDSSQYIAQVARVLNRNLANRLESPCAYG